MACLNCPQTEEILDMETVMYNGFGGYSLNKNGNYYQSALRDLEWEQNPTVKDWTKIANRDITALWEIEMNLPLRSAKWKYTNGIWKLVEKGNGFA